MADVNGMADAPAEPLPTPEALRFIHPIVAVFETALNVDEKYTLALALDRFAAQACAAATGATWQAAIEFVEGGRFLHDAAPPARFAKECAKAMRERGSSALARPTGGDNQ